LDSDQKGLSRKGHSLAARATLVDVTSGVPRKISIHRRTRTYVPGKSHALTGRVTLLSTAIKKLKAADKIKKEGALK